MRAGRAGAVFASRRVVELSAFASFAPSHWGVIAAGETVGANRSPSLENPSY